MPERFITTPWTVVLAAAEALRLAAQVCEALDYAHRQGVVHRDIKPENILMEGTSEAGPTTGQRRGRIAGRIKIADFGLVRLLEPTPADFTLTTPEHLLGTPPYMAPEQIERAHETDHRADIYSLGVVLYEMLTGELPLGRFDPPTERMTSMGRGPAPAPQKPSPGEEEAKEEAKEEAPGEEAPGEETPGEGEPGLIVIGDAALLVGRARQCARLDGLVLRCLEKDPAWRYQDATALRDELASLAAWFSDPAAAPAPSPPGEAGPKQGRKERKKERKKKRRWSWASWATAVLIAVVLADLGWQVGTRVFRAEEPVSQEGPSQKAQGKMEEKEKAGPARPAGPEPRQPISFRTTVRRSPGGPPFRSIQLAGGTLKGDGVQYTLKVSFGRFVHGAWPGSDYLLDR